MRKSNGDKRPYLRPVTRIELSEKNIKWRLILLVLCLSIAAAALFVGVRELLNVDPGWQQVEISSKNPNCAGDFVLMYDYSDYGGSTAAANKKLTALYTEAAEKAFLLFAPDVEDASVQNLWLVNRHINEPVTVDPVLYEALAQIWQAENRSLYLAPAYEEYNRIFLCENQEEAALYDPAFDGETRDYLMALAAFAADPEAIDLELLEGNQVRLTVSEDYLAFARENEIETFLDFGWMKNAFIADYLARTLTENGFTSGYLTSFDGFTRNLDPRGNLYSLNIFCRRGLEAAMPARLSYTGPMSIVQLRDFPMTEQDRWHYFAYSSGHITSVYLDPAQGLRGPATDSLTGYSREKGCAQILLELAPVFLAGEWDAAGLENLNLTDALWIEDHLVCTTDPEASLEILDQAYSLK